MAFTPSASDFAQRAARTARRKALEAQYRAAKAAGTGPRCATCGSPQSLALVNFQAGRSSGCCSGVVSLPWA